jgi:hypothetical protein
MIEALPALQSQSLHPKRFAAHATSRRPKTFKSPLAGSGLYGSAAWLFKADALDPEG